MADMTVRRLASLALVAGWLSVVVTGASSCVVRTRGDARHPAKHAHHHCHDDRRGCHAHVHGPGHHR
jgi:hypothetical protein